MLWPRGAQIRAQTFRLTNRYEPSEECDRLLVEVAVGRQRPRIDLSSETWFEQLAREIVEHGTAELMTDVTNATGLATAVRRLAEEPIDSEILLTHARLVGFRRDGGALIAEFDLPEAFQ
jgi:dihydropteroate synthase